MINEISRKDCTGCYACYNVCPTKCIVFNPDENGFLFPEIKGERCIKCKKCLRCCPLINEPVFKNERKKPNIFAAWSLDEEIRFTSTSGGIFSELAKSVIQQNGFVVGAKYNEDFLVEHTMIEKEEEIKILRQSKYTQSMVGGIYLKIEEKLKSGNKVAFCGTPCQVAGLLNFLKKPYENLYTFDFICRGSNSPKAYKKYLKMLEEQYGSLVNKVWFKNKALGWNKFSTRIEFENGKIYSEDRYNDLYMRGYIEENLYMRDCCFDCKYKKLPRLSDLTLGDFWGAGEIEKSLDEDKGTSVVFINTTKGERLFDSINKCIFKKEVCLENVLPGNGCVFNSALKNSKRDKFLVQLDKQSFDQCFSDSVKKNLRKRLKNVLLKAVNKLGM